MNRNTLIIVVVLILVLLGIWFVANNNTQNTTQNTTVAPTQAMTEATPTPKNEITIQLNEQNNSSESGTATLTEENGKVKVTLNIANTPNGVSQPAHIHVGSCPNPGDVKYPLTSVVNGVSETTLGVSLAELRALQPIAINVHKSAPEIKTYVSCGNLTL